MANTGFKTHSDHLPDHEHSPEGHRIESVKSEEPTLNQPAKPEAASPQIHLVGTPVAKASQPETAPPGTQPPDASKPSASEGRLAGAVGGLTTHVGLNRKKYTISGVIAAAIISIVFGFIALLPLKLEALIKSIYTHEFGRIEQYADRRAVRVVAKYMSDKVGGAAATDRIYIGNTLFSTLYGNMQLNKFEQKLLDDKGIKFEGTNKRGEVKITLADGTPGGTFANDSKLAEFLDRGPLKGREANRAIKAFTRDQTKFFQVMKRRHLRRYIRNAYGVFRWGIPKRTDKEATSIDPKAASITTTDIAEQTLTITEQGDAKALAVMLGDKAPNPNERQFPDGGARGLTPFIDPAATETDSTVNEGKSQAQSELDNATKDGISEVKKLDKATIKAGVDKVIAKIFENAAVQALGKAIPIVGWVALASDVDNFMWNGKLRVVLIALHQAQYASVFATYASLADQLKAGKLSATQIGDIMEKLAGSENSNTFQLLFMNSNTGTKMDPSKGVNNSADNPFTQSGYFCDIGSGLAQLTGNGPTPPSDVTSADYWTWVYRSVAATPPGFHTPLCLVHPVLSKLNGIIGSIINTVFDWSIKIFDGIIGLFGGGHPLRDLLKAATEAAASLIKWVMTHVLLPVATGYEVGPALLTAMGAGGDVIGQGYARDTLGGKTMTYPQVNAQRISAAREDTLQLHRQGFMASLFSLDSSQSFASRFIAMMPATPTAAVSSLGNSSLAFVTNPFHFFGTFGLALLPLSSADNLTADPYGVQQYGYDDSDLGRDLQLPTVDIHGPPDSSGELTGPDGITDEWDCPETPDPHISNLCLLDVTTVQAMNSNYTTEDDGGLGAN